MMTPDPPSHHRRKTTQQSKHPAPCLRLPPCLPAFAHFVLSHTRHSLATAKRKEKWKEGERGTDRLPSDPEPQILDRKTAKRIRVSTSLLPCRAPGAVIGSATPAGVPANATGEGQNCGKWSPFQKTEESNTEHRIQTILSSAFINGGLQAGPPGKQLPQDFVADDWLQRKQLRCWVSSNGNGQSPA